jgi:hypothetical protein
VILVYLENCSLEITAYLHQNLLQLGQIAIGIFRKCWKWFLEKRQCNEDMFWILLHQKHNILGTTFDCMRASLWWLHDQNMLKSKIKTEIKYFWLQCSHEVVSGKLRYVKLGWREVSSLCNRSSVSPRWPLVFMMVSKLCTVFLAKGTSSLLSLLLLTCSGVVFKFSSSLKCVDDVEMKCVDDVEMATSEQNRRRCKLSEGPFPWK